MRKISALFFIIICLTTLVFSYSAWKGKIQAAGSPAQAPQASEAQKTAAPPAAAPVAAPSFDIASLTANMDSGVREVFHSRLAAGEQLQLLVAGSEAMDSGSPGYATLVQEALEAAYPGFLQVDLLSFDGTSADFLEEDIDLSAGYDVIVLEPFTLNNNGLVEIEREHEHIAEFASRLRTEVLDAVLVLQPPQPIYGAQFYLTQVRGLEEFALRHGIAYVDHWTAWPETTDVRLKDYLTDSGSPGQRGAEAWATELNTYFIAQ